MENIKNFLVAVLALTFTLSFIGCSKDEELVINDPVSSDKLKITVGSSVFTASLYDNATANAFKAMLPLTINMGELNRNEKFYDFPSNLPSNAANVGPIQNGDIMLYGSRTLVLFYISFSTSYNYTRIGKIDNTSGYAVALGSATLNVTFELE